MTFALLVTAVLAADGGSPFAGPNLDNLVRSTKDSHCAVDANSRACAALTAFLSAKSAAADKALLAIGHADMLSLSRDARTAEDAGVAILSVTPRSKAAPATAAMLPFHPENADEVRLLSDFVADAKAGKADPKSKLHAVLRDAIGSLRQSEVKNDNGSLCFDRTTVFSGQWVRTAGGRYFLFGFAESSGPPKVVVAELYPLRR